MSIRRVIRALLCITISMFISLTFCAAGDSSVAHAADCSLSAPTNLVLNSYGKNRIQLTWSKVKFSDGYQVFMYDNKKKKYIFKNTRWGANTNNCRITKLRKNKTYYFKVRAFRNEKGGARYSDFSISVKGRTKGYRRNVSKLLSKASGSTYYLKRGGTKQLSVTVYPKKRVVSKKITYVSSNSRVASVSSKGRITANNYGTAIISAIAHNGKKRNFVIRVRSEYAESIPVLTYHNIVSEEIKNTKYKNDEWAGSVEDFKMQMKYLYDNGYKTISMDEFYNWYKGNIELPKKTVAITFDDGYVGLYTHVIPVLKQYDFKATAFIIGKYCLKETTTGEDVSSEETQKNLPGSIESNPDDVDVSANDGTIDTIESEETNSMTDEMDNNLSGGEEENESEKAEEDNTSDPGTSENSNEVDYFSLPETTRVNYELALKIKEEYPALDLQSHSYDLHYYDHGKQAIFMKTSSELEFDFKKMRDEGFEYVAYPYGSFSQGAVNTISKHGYKLGFGFGMYYKNATRYDPWYDISRVKINGQISFRDFVSKVKPE